MAIATTHDTEIYSTASNGDSPDKARGISKYYQGNLTYEDLQVKLTAMLDEGHSKAMGLSLGRHRKFAQFRLMRDARWRGDAKNDPLAQLGWYVPFISHLIDYTIAIEIKDLIPDSQSMDFVQAMAKWQGTEGYSEKITSSLQDNFRRMKPTGAPGGWLEALADLRDDCRTLGTCIAFVNHQSHAGGILPGLGTRELYEDAATVQIFDPSNFNPWQIDTPSPDAATLWDPLQENEVDEEYPDLPDDIWKKIKQKYSGGAAVPNRDPIAQGDRGISSTDDTDAGARGAWVGAGHEGACPRKRYLGCWPEGRLERAFGGYEVYPGKAAIIKVLADKFVKKGPVTRGQAVEARQQHQADKDAWIERAMDAKWWLMDWDSDLLIWAEPYPLDLPPGFTPWEISRLHKRPQKFWGDGMYDRGVWGEKGINFNNRVLVTLGLFMSNPAATLLTSAIDPKWIQQHGQAPRIRPGMTIPLLQQIQGDPWKAFVPGAEYVPAITAELQRLEAQTKENLGAGPQLEGQAKGKTATQDQQNLQQQLTLLNFEIECARSFMQNLAIRCYVVKSQAMKIIDQPEWVPSCEADAQLQHIEVKPDDLLHLSLVDIRCVGNNTPGSRIQQVQALIEGLKLFMQAGGTDLAEAQKIYWKLAKVPWAERLIKTWSPQDMQNIMANVQHFFGPGAIQQLPPAMMQQIMQIMAANQMPPGIPPAMNPAMLPGAGGGTATPFAGGGMPNAGNTPSAPDMAGSGAGMNAGIGS